MKPSTSLPHFIFFLIILLCTVNEIFTFRSSTTTISKTTWGGGTKSRKTITILSVSKEPHPPNKPPNKNLGVPYFLENEEESGSSTQKQPLSSLSTGYDKPTGKEILQKGSSRVDQALPKKPKPPNNPPPSDIFDKENSYFSNVEGTPAEIAIQAAGDIFGPLFKPEIEHNVSKEKIAGAALASASYGLLSTMSLATSSVAALGAAYVAIKPGAAGKVARLIGTLTWTLGKTLIEEFSDQSTTNTSGVSSSLANTERKKPLFSDQDESDFLKVIAEAEKAVGLAVENEKKMAENAELTEKQSLEEKEFLKALEEAEKAVELAVENEKKIMEEVAAQKAAEEEEAKIVEEKTTKPAKKKRTTSKIPKTSSSPKAEEKEPDLAEEARIAEEKRLAVIARLEEEKRALAEEKANEERIAAEKAEVEKRLAQEEAKAAEEVRIAAEKKAKVAIPYDAAAKLAYDTSDKTISYVDFKIKYEANAVELVKSKREEKIASEKKAEEERLAAEKKAEEERLAAEKKAEEERLAAEKKAEEERLAAEKKAEQERIAAEKVEAERIAAEKVEAERIEAEESQDDALAIEDATAEERRFEAIAKRAEARRAEVAEAAAEARRQRLAEENKAIEAVMTPEVFEDDAFISEEDWEASVDLAKQLDPELYGDGDGATPDYFDIDALIREKAKEEMIDNDDNSKEQISLKRASIKDPEKIIDKLEAETKYIEKEKQRHREEWDISGGSEVSDNFEQMTVAQLKEELRNQGLKVSGRKAELIERLRA